MNACVSEVNLEWIQDDANCSLVSLQSVSALKMYKKLYSKFQYESDYIYKIHQEEVEFSYPSTFYDHILAGNAEDSMHKW